MVCIKELTALATPIRQCLPTLPWQPPRTGAADPAGGCTRHLYSRTSRPESFTHGMPNSCSRTILGLKRDGAKDPLPPAGREREVGG